MSNLDRIAAESARRDAIDAYRQRLTLAQADINAGVVVSDGNGGFLFADGVTDERKAEVAAKPWLWLTLSERYEIANAYPSLRLVES